MTQISFAFEGFPWFNAKRRPVHISGIALCKLVKITPSRIDGDHPTVAWRVERVECQLKVTGKTVVNFNDERKDIDDFANWLRGKHGFTVAALLRAAHERETAAAELTQDAQA